jgi:hypothetical protein
MVEIGRLFSNSCAQGISSGIAFSGDRIAVLRVWHGSEQRD